MNGRSTNVVEQAEKWSEMFRTDDGVFAVDSSQRIIHWGASAQAIMGYAVEEVMGRPCYEVVGGVDGGNFRFCRRNCPVMVNALRGRPTVNYDVSTHTKSGEQMWVNITILVPDGAGRRNAHVVHLFRDVTERRRLERAARRVVADLRDVLEERSPAQRTPTLDVPAPCLTQRESQVLKLLACGVTTRKIASTLGVSPITARNHITNLLTKLGVENRLQAVVYASQNHLL